MEKEIKSEIIKILELYEFDPSIALDSERRHIDSGDYKNIARDIIQLFKDYENE